jgi:hypothetical protein
MFTSAEAQELRAYYARYPFDDEANHWMPHGMLMAEIRNRLLVAGSEQKTALDFMPFAQEKAEPEPVSEPRPYSKKQLKRIQKYKGW